MKVHLRRLATALPERRYTQADLYAHSPWGATDRLDRLFLESDIATRALWVPPSWWSTPRTLTETMRAWKEGALALGEAALRGLDRPASEIDALFVTTVTGVATPGLDLGLAARMGMRPDLARAHLNQHGCHAAIPLLRLASDHLRVRPEQRVVALAVEVCSACFAPSDEPENLVALSLFADGAAAVELSTEPVGPVLVDFDQHFALDTLDLLGFDLGDRGFRIRLDPRVPDVIASALGPAVDRLLTRHGLGRADIATWCLHPGGRRILDAAQLALGLDDGAMRASRRVLRAMGNMSSPSILFVLDEALRHARPGWILAAAFGPGVGIELLLARLDVATASKRD